MSSTHGSDAVEGGSLKGSTDKTDYFYFLCPNCPDQQIMRVLDYETTKDQPGNRYNDQCKSKAKRTFTIKLELFCEKCRLHDYTKISNDGWQGGEYPSVA